MTPDEPDGYFHPGDKVLYMGAERTVLDVSSRRISFTDGTSARLLDEGKHQ